MDKDLFGKLAVAVAAVIGLSVLINGVPKTPSTAPSSYVSLEARAKARARKADMAEAKQVYETARCQRNGC